MRYDEMPIVINAVRVMSDTMSVVTSPLLAAIVTKMIENSLICDRWTAVLKLVSFV